MADHDNQTGDGAAADEKTDRRASERRGIDRRAFWRPTPDRRRESSEQGRRESDQAE